MLRGTATWGDANTAIRDEVDNHNALDLNLSWAVFPMGATFRFGETLVTMVHGVTDPPASYGVSGSSESNNAGSIVIRVVFADRSILFTGDAVGRHIGDPNSASLGSEREMVRNAAVIPIDSDVLIAPHHGADNGISAAFIHAVSPTWVVFPAGHDHEHPRESTAARYLAHGVALGNMLRTDLGDDESDQDGTDANHREWNHGRVNGNTDPAGDDDVDILIRPTGEVVVAYRN